MGIDQIDVHHGHDLIYQYSFMLLIIIIDVKLKCLTANDPFNAAISDLITDIYDSDYDMSPSGDLYCPT